MKLIDKDALVAEIEKRQKEEVFYDEDGSFASWADQNHYYTLESIKEIINSLEVKELEINSISENLAEAYEYLGYTSTGNLAHNKPMVSASLRRAFKMLYNAGLFQLTHDVRYRMESLGIKAQ